MIEFRNLSKVYGSHRALDRLNLTVEPGQVFGFLGPNGAGKTTTIRLMMGVLVPSEGSVSIDAKDCSSSRVEVMQLVGYVPDEPHFYEYLKGYEILQFVAEMHGLNRHEASTRGQYLLEQFSLLDAAEEFAVNYSHGMKKKLSLACAMIHQPSYLILDEPTNGLDPRSSRIVQRQLTDFAAQGGTVFLSSHLLNLVEDLCAQIAVVDQGQLKAFGSLDQIRESTNARGDLEGVFLQLTDEESSGEAVE